MRRMKQLFTREGGKIFFAVFVLCCLLNLYNLSNFEISVDDELHHAGGFPLARRLFGLGRWGAGVIIALLPQPPVVPFSTSLLFCLSLAATLLLISELHAIRKPGIILALTPVFVLFPSWAAMESFECILHSISAGLLLTAIAAYLSRRLLMHGSRRPWLQTAAILGLLAFAIGCYQSFVLLYLAIGVASTLHAAHHGDNGSAGRPLIVQLGLFFGYALGASGVSIALAQLFQGLLSIGALPYLDSFMNPDDLAVSRWGGNLTTGLVEMAKFYGGSESVYGYSFPAILLLLIVSVVLVLRRGIGQGLRQLVAQLLLLLLLLALPFSFSFLGGNLPTRSLLALPYIAWFLALLLIEAIQAPRMPAAAKLIMAGSLAVVIVQSLALNGAYSAASELVNRHDTALASQLYTRLAEADPNLDRTKPIVIGFRGRAQYTSAYAVGDTSTLGSSIFDWGNGKPRRMAAYMRLVGYATVQAMSKAELASHGDQLDRLPRWPAPGSLIRIAPNRFLVNLGQD